MPSYLSFLDDAVDTSLEAFALRQELADEKETALLFDTAVIAAGDPEDIRRLAAPFPRIGIFSV